MLWIVWDPEVGGLHGSRCEACVASSIAFVQHPEGGHLGPFRCDGICATAMRSASPQTFRRTTQMASIVPQAAQLSSLPMSSKRVWSSGLTFASHAKGREFDPHYPYFCRGVVGITMHKRMSECSRLGITALTLQSSRVGRFVWCLELSVPAHA